MSFDVNPLDDDPDPHGECRHHIQELESRFTAPVVVMCGSVRFRSTWSAEMARLTDEGNIVLTVSRMLTKATGKFDPAHKERLDALHKRKIDLADWVWVLDVGGYVGSSTKSEIAYAEQIGRPVRYLSREFPQFVEPPDHITELEAALTAASTAIHAIVCADGVDAGVIYLSSDSPTHFDPERNCHVYEHENFSPLGDALVRLAKIIDAARQK